VGVVVMLSGLKGVGEECDRADFIIRVETEDVCNVKVKGVHFDSHRQIWGPVEKYWGSVECIFQTLKNVSPLHTKVPWGIFPCQVGEEYCDVRALMDKLLVEVSKTQERLDVPDVVGIRPHLDGHYFSGIHSEAI